MSIFVLVKSVSLLFLFFVLVSSALLGQTFAPSPACNVTAIVEDVFIGTGVSFADFNGDGWPDLTYLEYNELVCYDNQEGLCVPLDLGIELDYESSMPAWVDFDNDGDRDLFVTQYQGQDRLFENDGAFNFTDISDEAGIPDFPAPSIGQSWADYDNDGDLDVFISKYIFVLDPDNPNISHYYNHTYENNGDGTFTNVTLSSGLSDGISLTLASTWIDYDKDGWLDLFCVNDMEDPNRMYHNNGDGTFDEVSDETGTTLADMHAMTATAGDFNNDGWEDLFISNIAIEKCALLLNNQDGTFTNIAADAGVELDSYTWGGNFADVDLDGDLDLFVSEYHFDTPGLANFLLRNNGDSTFTDISSTSLIGDQSDSYSVASADWNRDGRIDFAVSNIAPQPSDLWVAEYEQGRFLSIDPVGVVSNREGVGVSIECWAGDLYQYRLTKLGEHYMAQDSDAEHFGFGFSNSVDSVRLCWPSGIIDTWYDVDINQFLVLEEGSSFVVEVSADADGICPGQEILIEAISPSPVTWNTGETGHQITADGPGWYVASSTNQSGTVYLDSVFIEELTPYTANWTITHPECFGLTGLAQLDNSVAFSEVIWPVGQTGEVLFAGSYEVNLVDEQGCALSSILEILQPDSLIAAPLSTSVSCYGDASGSVALNPSGGTPPYAITGIPTALDALLAATYVATVTDTNGCTLEVPFTITTPDSLALELNFDCLLESVTASVFPEGGTPPYNYSWSDGTFEASMSGSLGTAYSVLVTDSLGCIATDDFLCATGIEELEAVLSVFPNPTSGELWIQGLKTCENVTVRTLEGRTVSRQRACNGSTISLALLASGTYLLHTENQVIRIVVQD